MTLYTGLDPDTGTTIADDAQLAASLRDLLTTPIGSRVMRRDYGSNIPDLIDAPMNGATLLRLASASYIAIKKWEPRLDITRIQYQPSTEQPGLLTVSLTATRTDRPEGSAPTTLEIAL